LPFLSFGRVATRTSLAGTRARATVPPTPAVMKGYTLLKPDRPLMVRPRKVSACLHATWSNLTAFMLYSRSMNSRSREVRQLFKRASLRCPFSIFWLVTVQSKSWKWGTNALGNISDDCQGRTIGILKHPTVERWLQKPSLSRPSLAFQEQNVDP
jgi:hypothetical protein